MKYLYLSFFIFIFSIAYSQSPANAGADVIDCSGNDFSRVGNQPNTNEIGFWIDEDGFDGVVGDTIFSTTIDFNLTDISTNRFVYIIKDTLSNLFTSDTLLLTVLDIPDLSGSEITTSGTACIGDTLSLSTSTVFGVSNYEWIALNNGKLLSNSLTNNQLVIFEASTTVKVVGENTCGTSDTVSISILSDSLPSQPFTINGTSIICESASNTLYDINTIGNPDADTYSWSTSSELINLNNTTGSTTDVLIGSANNMSFDLTATAQNACGSGLAISKTIEIVSPTSLDITVGTGTNNLFCLSDATTTLTANSISGTTNGLTPTYRFLLNNIEVQGHSTLNTYSAVSLSDGDNITVEIIGDENGCYVMDTNQTSISLLGINNPSTFPITASSVNYCANGIDTITATFSSISGVTETITWFKNGVALSSTNMTLIDLIDSTTSYFYQYQNNVCPPSNVQSDLIEVIVDEQPTIQYQGNDSLTLQLNGQPINFEPTFTVDIENLGNSNLLYQSSLDGLASSVQSSVPVTLIDAKGTYSYYLNVSNGLCKDSLELTLIAISEVGFSDLTSSNSLFYPNPSQSSWLTLEKNFSGSNVTIYNINGKKVYQEDTQDIIPIGHLNKGIYFVHLSKGSKQYVSKLIVE